MSTTFVDFVVSPNQPFQFQAVLDGETYNVITTWNLFGQRYFINIYSDNGVLVLSIARIGSPAGFDISMTAGYFTTKLVWRQANNQYEIIEP
jgi:hypothetical protein